MGITVVSLLNERFLSRTRDRQVLIVLEGKPRPIQIDNFNSEIYDQVYWLTGSEILQRFFCWPCLLFREEGEEWNVKFDKQAFLLDCINCHDYSSDHLEAALKYRRFLQSLNSEHLNGINEDLNQSEFYKVFRKNQDILKLLIAAVITVVTEDKPYRKTMSSHSQISPDSCIKAINVLKLCNNTRFNYFEDAIKLVEMNPTLLDDLVDSMVEVMTCAVADEVKMSTYASLIFSSHHTSSTKCQISAVLRYIRKGKVCQRFLGFINISRWRRVDTMCDIISSAIEEFQISDKFLSYSFDGEVLELDDLKRLNTLLQEQYPQSYFVPCYFHGILCTFQQSLSVYRELAQFFEIFDFLEDFFKEGSKQRIILENLIIKNSTNENLELYSNANFIKIVCFCRTHVVEALKIMTSNRNYCSADEYSKVGRCIQVLEEFYTICLLHVWSPFYEHILHLEESLRIGSPETEFRSIIIPTFLRNIQTQQNMFQECFKNACDEIVGQNKELMRKLEAHTHSAYTTIIYHLKKETALRFSKLDELSFCTLVNYNAVNASQFNFDFSKVENIPNLNFTSQLLSSEVMMQQKCNIFERKNAYDLLHFFEDENYYFPCTKKLLEFALTLPFKPPVKDGDSSILQKLNTLSYSTYNTKHGDASTLYAESNLLRDLQSHAFYCCVLQVFYK